MQRIEKSVVFTVNQQSKNMKNVLKISFILIASSLIFFGCKKDNEPNRGNYTDYGNFDENFGSKVNRDFFAEIIDESGNPIVGAKVEVGGKSEITDKNGVVAIKGAAVYEKFAYIKTSQMGYVNGSRTLIPVDGINNIKIMMLKSNLIGSVNSGQSGTVALLNGTAITFDGAFENADGSTYTGSVSVYVNDLSSNDNDLEAKMPGSLYGEDEDGEEKVLETFGMLHVSLIGSSGQDLEIAEGHEADIKMSIDPTHLADAPSTIPLWHFDEALGYWKEDGQATLVGDKYEGKVSHFSWWNCDARVPLVRLCIKILDGNNPLVRAYIKLIRSTGGFRMIRGAYTSSTGEICGRVPANEIFKIEIKDLCGTNSYTGTIGPFTQNTTLPPIQLSGIIKKSTIKGKLVDCNNNPVKNGYVTLDFGSKRQIQYVNSSTGDFSIDVMYCAGINNYSLVGLDIDNKQESNKVTGTVSNGSTANLGNVRACNTVAEYVSFKIDAGQTTLLTTNPYCSTDSSQTGDFSMGASGGNDYCYITSTTNVVGIHPYSSTNGMTIYGRGINIDPNNTITIKFDLKKYGTVGNYVDVTFSGDYYDKDGIKHTITGDAHIIRDF